MPGRQAKLLAPAVINRMLFQVQQHSRFPDRDAVIILLSVRAGLRAAEIAQLRWPMVLDAQGRVCDTLVVTNQIAKKGSGRRVPMHRQLREALVMLLVDSDRTASIIQSARGGAMKPNSIVNWFVQLFVALDIEGCSSHSGRRTFITFMARHAHKAGCSLRDVQILAGHRSIETTQQYIDGDSNAQRRLVSLL